MSPAIFLRSKLGAQGLILLLQRFEARPDKRERRRELGLAKSRHDMLRAVPVERDEMDDEFALDLGSVLWQGELRHEFRIGGKIPRLDMRIDLEPAPVRVVHGNSAPPGRWRQDCLC